MATTANTSAPVSTKKLLVYFPNGEPDNKWLNLDRWAWCEVVREYREEEGPGSGQGCAAKLVDVRHPMSGRISRGHFKYMTYKSDEEFKKDMTWEARVMWTLKPWIKKNGTARRSI